VLLAVAVLWGLVALSYNAELAEGKRQVELANDRLTGLNGELTKTNGKLDDALARVTKEKGEADRLRAEAEQLRVKAEGSEHTARALLYVNTVQRAEAAAREGRRELALKYLNDLKPEQFGGHDFRGPEWHFVQRLTANQLVLEKTTSEPTDLRVNEDGTTVTGVVNEKRNFSVDEHPVHTLFDTTTGNIRRSHSIRWSVTKYVPGSDTSTLFGADQKLQYFSRDSSFGLEHEVPGRVLALALGRDEKYAAAICNDGAETSVVVWNVGQPKPVWKTAALEKNGADRLILEFIGNNKYLLESTRLWDVTTGKLMGDVPWGQLACATSHPGGGWFAFATKDGRIEVRDVHDLNILRLWDNIPATSMTAAGANTLVVGGRDGIVRVLDVTTGSQWPDHLRFPDVVRSVGYRVKDLTVVATDGRQVQFLAKSEMVIPSAAKGTGQHGPMVSFATNDEVLVPVSMEGIRSWNPSDGRLNRMIRFGVGKNGKPLSFIDVAGSSSKRFQAVGSGTNAVSVWDSHSTKSIEVPIPVPHHLSSQRITISTDSKYLAVAGSKEVSAIDLDAQKNIWVIPEFPELGKTPGFPSAIAFSPDSESLYIAWRTSRGSALSRHELNSQSRTFLFEPHSKEAGAIHSVVPCRDGGVLTATRNGEVKLWSSKQIELRSFVGHRGSVNGAAISPDERRLATTGDDGTVRLWDVESGLELFALGKHTAKGMGVAFSPDGARIASTGSDGTLRIWSVGPNHEVLPPPRAADR
jgi:WD40 repeat protein